MLEHLQLTHAATRLMGALEGALASGAVTADLGGTLTTIKFANAIANPLD